MAAATKPAYQQATKPAFKPFVPATETRPELSVRALLLGAVFGILFGAVTVYVGLRAGLTVAASIPISVLSISILRAFGKASILENNIVQTTGNAGQSIASGVIFTLPALIFLGFDLESTRIFALALFGGWLGVLFMIPLRKQLIVDEHETLTYPEGTACADVLEAGERGGSFASRVFLGLGLGGLYTLFQNENLFGLFPSTPNYQPDLGPQHLLRGSAIRADVTPEYLGVGYIIGIRVAAVMLAGGAFSWLVLMPAIVFFGSHLATPLYPGTVPIADMSPSDLWKTYIRPMGAGAVAAAGLITLLRTLPTIVSALTEGFRTIGRNRSGDASRGSGNAGRVAGNLSRVGSSARAAAGTLRTIAGGQGIDPLGRKELVALAERAESLRGGAKSDRLLALVGEFPDKMVIFTQFLATQEMLRLRLSEAGHDVAVFHGGLSRLEKEAAIERFRGPSRLLLCTEAGSEGRNLQFAHAVCNFDLPWNPMRIEQRIGRLSRIGQTRDVHVFNLVAAGTAEAVVLHLLDAKLNMFELVIGEIDTILGNLDDDREFQDVVADLWTDSDDLDDFSKRVDVLGDRILEAKRAYLERRKQDDRLFGNRFTPEA